VELGLAEGALEAEQHAIVEVAGVIQSVLVADERVGQPADLQQPVPVCVVAGQSAALEAEYDTGPSHADVGHEPLEAFSVGGGGARVALVDIDDDDLFGCPAQLDGSSA
jgi:hypothetical protein